MKKILSSILAAIFITQTIFQSTAIAQSLPIPSTVVQVSPAFTPALVRGITLHPDNPLKFDFIVDPGEEKLADEAFQAESMKLIKYFLASLTVPEGDMWVNLSPTEKDRIIPDELGKTAMGRDLLLQDYTLKQLTAQFLNPKDKIGKEFWNRVYQEVQEKHGSIDIPTETFNKVWIIPEKAEVYVQGKNVFVVGSELKVMLEEEYLADGKGLSLQSTDYGLQTKLMKEIIIPALEKEVNEGKNFAPLRQIQNSAILAAWYKKNLKESLLSKVYVDQKKMEGIETGEQDTALKVYNQYLDAFKKGAYDYIKEDYNPNTQEVVSRKYISGGIVQAIDAAMSAVPNLTTTQRAVLDQPVRGLGIELRQASFPDAAIVAESDQALLSAQENVVITAEAINEKLQELFGGLKLKSGERREIPEVRIDTSFKHLGEDGFSFVNGYTTNGGDHDELLLKYEIYPGNFNPVAFFYDLEERIPELKRGKTETALRRQWVLFKAQYMPVLGFGGAGPAVMGAASEALLEGFRVDVFNRDIKYGGLAEYGIYLDKDGQMKERYRKTTFADIMHHPNLNYYGNITIGDWEEADLSFDQLRKMGYAAIFVGLGAEGSSKLGIVGEDDFDNVFDAKDITYHYNGQPLFQKLAPRFGKRLAIVGAGNVAVDITNYAIHKKDYLVVQRFVSGIGKSGLKKIQKIMSGRIEDLEAEKAEFKSQPEPKEKEALAAYREQVNALDSQIRHLKDLLHRLSYYHPPVGRIVEMDELKEAFEKIEGLQEYISLLEATWASSTDIEETTDITWLIRREPKNKKFDYKEIKKLLRYWDKDDLIAEMERIYPDARNILRNISNQWKRDQALKDLFFRKIREDYKVEYENVQMDEIWAKMGTRTDKARIRFRFLSSPAELQGEKVEGKKGILKSIKIKRTADTADGKKGSTYTLEFDSMVRSIGNKTDSVLGIPMTNGLASVENPKPSVDERKTREVNLEAEGARIEKQRKKEKEQGLAGKWFTGFSLVLKKVVPGLFSGGWFRSPSYGKVGLAVNDGEDAFKYAILPFLKKVSSLARKLYEASSASTGNSLLEGFTLPFAVRPGTQAQQLRTYKDVKKNVNALLEELRKQDKKIVSIIGEESLKGEKSDIQLLHAVEEAIGVHFRDVDDKFKAIAWMKAGKLAEDFEPQVDNPFAYPTVASDAAMLEETFESALGAIKTGLRSDIPDVRKLAIEAATDKWDDPRLNEPLIDALTRPDETPENIRRIIIALSTVNQFPIDSKAYLRASPDDLKVHQKNLSPILKSRISEFAKVKLVLIPFGLFQEAITAWLTQHGKDFGLVPGVRLKPGSLTILDTDVSSDLAADIQRAMSIALFNRISFIILEKYGVDSPRGQTFEEDMYQTAAAFSANPQSNAESMAQMTDFLQRKIASGEKTSLKELGQLIDWFAVPDAALTAETQEEVPGGIDLNANESLIKQTGDQINLPIPSNPAQWENLNVNGFVPVIIHVTPLMSLPLLLGEALPNPPMEEPINVSALP